MSPLDTGNKPGWRLVVGGGGGGVVDGGGGGEVKRPGTFPSLSPAPTSNASVRSEQKGAQVPAHSISRSLPGDRPQE